MILLNHASASSLNAFIECPSAWLTKYDPATKMHIQTDKNAAGTLVHGALEYFRNPINHFEQTEENLIKCYKQYCGSRSLGESLDVFKRGLKLCKKVWELDQNHPTLPMHLAETIAVEWNLDLQFPSLWSLPIIGAIDRVAIIPGKSIDGELDLQECALLIEDYKTGNAKTLDQLTTEDVQPVIYFLYAKHVIKPQLEAQGWIVKKIGLVWSYVDHGESISMDEEDFEDLEAIVAYIGNLMEQMLSLVDKWNGLNEENKKEFLAKYEKRNRHCSWCPRKSTCTTFAKALDLDLEVDLTNPALSWEDFFTERDRLALAAKEFDERRKAADGIVRTYLEMENKEYILAGGFEWTAPMVHCTDYPIEEVEQVLGRSFIQNAAQLTAKTIEAELARLKVTNLPAYLKAKKEIDGIAARHRRPGYRVIKPRKEKLVS